MNELTDVVSWLLICAGLFFFVSGSIGLIRFPDALCRLHAVTKADTLGLGLTAAGIAFRSTSGWTVLQLVIIWLLVVASGAVTCQLLARYNLQASERKEDGREDTHG
jgi:multicomponent Na+:H+ antiporter subunit G